MNYHKPHGVKQHRFILLWFWRSDVQYGSHRTNVNQGVSTSAFLLENLAKNQFLAFQAFRDPLDFLVCGSVLHLQANSITSSNLFLTRTPVSFITSLLILILLSLSYKTLIFWTHRDNPRQSPHQDY